MMTTSRKALLEEAARFVVTTHFVDSGSPELQQFVARALRDLPDDASQTDKTIRLFEAVRDGIRYDPYTFALRPVAYRAIAGAEAAFCVPKAILLAVCLRAAGIPAALGFADVRNHLNTPKLQELRGTDLFVYHGYVQLCSTAIPIKSRLRSTWNCASGSGSSRLSSTARVTRCFMNSASKTSDTWNM